MSQFGDALYYLIFIFMVDKLTGDAAMVGVVGALQALPFVLLGPIAGVVADRVDRRRVMLAADLLSALVLLGLGLLLLIEHRPPLWVVFATACLLSVVNTFFAPAKSAAIPRLVPAERLIEANSLSAATQSLMPLLGLGLSGSVLGLIYKLYPDYFFLSSAVLNGLTFLYSASCIARLPTLAPLREEISDKHVLHDSVEGVRFVFRHHVLKVVLLLNLFLQLFVSPFMVVYVIANRQWFGGEYVTLASFEFGFVLGMLAGALWVGKAKIVRPGMAMAVSLAIVGVGVALMAYSRTFWLFLFWNLVCGVALPFAQVPLQTYVQIILPDEYRGRVGSAFMMLAMGVMPVGMLLAGTLTDAIGLVWMFLLMGGGMLVSSLVGLLDRPFREARLPDQAESTSPPVEPSAV